MMQGDFALNLPTPKAMIAILVLAVIGALTLFGGFVWFIVWLYMHLHIQLQG